MLRESSLEYLISASDTSPGILENGFKSRVN